jgi:hypothetical protein
MLNYFDETRTGPMGCGEEKGEGRTAKQKGRLRQGETPFPQTAFDKKIL